MKKLLLPLLLLLSLISNPANASSCSIPYLMPGIKSKGNVKYEVLFVQYPNSSKQSSKNLYNLIDFKTASDYFLKASNKKLKVKFESNYKWITMSKNADEYGIGPGSRNPNWQALEKAFLDEVISKADSFTDFSNNHGVVIVSDPNSIQFMNAPHDFVSADGKNLKTVLFNITWDTAGLVHELMHTFGLKDLYGHANYENPMGDLSIMSEYMSMPYPLGYERYLLGWMSDKNIECVPNGNISVKSGDKNVRLIISPISGNSVRVIEPKLNISYIVDSSIPNGHMPIRLG